jgi:hypothetical protein
LLWLWGIQRPRLSAAEGEALATLAEELPMLEPRRATALVCRDTGSTSILPSARIFS